jgi:hypothetical protein
MNTITKETTKSTATLELPLSLKEKRSDTYIKSRDLALDMFKVAGGLIESYHSDLLHDSRIIQTAKKGNCYLWIVRRCGTSLPLLFDPMTGERNCVKHSIDCDQLFRCFHC